MIKIYPCLAIAGTKAYQWYQEGTFEPYTTEQAANLIAEIKKTIPKWVRVMRVQRDIPARLILAGVTKSDVRELAQKKLKDQGMQCQCIRCREVGHRLAVDHVVPDLEKVKILTERYEASDGHEVFISAEDPENNVLLGYLRMRVPSPKAHRPEITEVPQRLCGNSTFTDHSSQSANIQRAHGSIKAMAKSSWQRQNGLQAPSLGSKSF